MTKKVNAKNTRDSNGKAPKTVMDYHKGTIKKNKFDTASTKVKKKYSKANG